MKSRAMWRCGAWKGQGQRENSIPRSIMQPVCRITAGTRFRFASMKGLPCVYTMSVQVHVDAHARATLRNTCIADAIYIYIYYIIQRHCLHS